MTAIADYSVQAGIYNALVQSYDALVQQTPFSCPTGNCTWAPFESLAICSTCNNVTHQLSRYQEPSYLYNDLTKRIAYNYFTPNATSFQLPNGLYINNVNGIPYIRPEDYTSSKVLEAIYMTFYGTGNASRTNEFRQSESLLWAMTFLKMNAPSIDSTRSNGWPNVTVEALECGLFYCVNQYSSAVRKGILYETEIFMENTTRDPQSWELIDYNPINLDNINIDNNSMNSLEFNNSTSSWPRTDLMFGNGFNLSWASVNSLSSQFQSQFTSAKTINDSDHKNFSRALDYTPINGYYKNQINSGDPSLVAYSPTVMQILYDSSNLNDTFRKIARSLSNAIRTGADNSTVQTGASGVLTTYFRIQWAWIVLHIIVMAGGAAFLLATIFETRRIGVPIWKSSALASLSQTNEIGDVLVGAGTLREMEVRASEHLLQLFQNSTEPSLIMKGPVSVAVEETPPQAQPKTGRIIEPGEHPVQSRYRDQGMVVPTNRGSTLQVDFESQEYSLTEMYSQFPSRRACLPSHSSLVNLKRTELHHSPPTSHIFSVNPLSTKPCFFKNLRHRSFRGSTSAIISAMPLLPVNRWSRIHATASRAIPVPQCERERMNPSSSGSGVLMPTVPIAWVGSERRAMMKSVMPFVGGPIILESRVSV